MNALLTGGGGFLGRHLLTALLDAGHTVVVAGRSSDGLDARARWIAMDLADAGFAWAGHLRGIDVVVNAAGIFRERPKRGVRFADVHVAGPIRLFDACVACGVRRVVQVSALGADDGARTAYHRSKRAADRHLLALPIERVVVQPSLLFGADGGSSRFFLAWAACPVVLLPGSGLQAIQPLHVDDAVCALRALVEEPLPAADRIPFVGPQPTTLKGYLQDLREGLGLAPAASVAVPRPLVDVAAAIGDRLPATLFDRASWQMLERGNTANPSGLHALLGAEPRPARVFIAREQAAALRLGARLPLAIALVRTSLAALWIWTAIVSLGLFPVEQSLALLGRAGVPEAWRPASLVAAALLDLLLGILTLAPLKRRARRALWIAQAALIGLYTLVITLRLPEFWLHPYGPLTKNLPLLAMLALLCMLDAPVRHVRKDR